MKSVIITVLLAISALAQAPKPGTVVDTGSSGGGGGGTGTVTSVVIAGTTNQITATGTCVGTVTITCTLSLPSGLVLPGTVNGLAITTTTGTITIASAKVLTVSNSLTLAGTDGVTLTFPTTSATIARTDAGQTFTGNQTMTALLQAGSTAPTQTQADNSTKVATTAYVDTGLATKGTGSTVYCNGTLSSGTITCTGSPAPSAYAAGMVVSLQVSAATTGATTLNISALGALPIISSGQAARLNSLTPGNTYTLTLDSSLLQFNLQQVIVPTLTVINPQGAPYYASGYLSQSRTTGTNGVGTTMNVVSGAAFQANQNIVCAGAGGATTFGSGNNDYKGTVSSISANALTLVSTTSASIPANSVCWTDGSTTTVGSTTSGSTTVVLANAYSYLASQGFYIAGAGAAGVDYIGTITAVSGNSITISPATATTVANGTLAMHDDTTSLQSCINQSLALGGVRCQIPDGLYHVNGPLQDTGGANSRLTLPTILVPASGTVPGVITVSIAGSTPPPMLYNQPPAMSPHVTGAILSSIESSGCILSGYNSASSSGHFTAVLANIENVTFRTADGASQCAANFSSVFQARVINVEIDTGVPSTMQSTPTVNVTALTWPQSANYNVTIGSNVICTGYFACFQIGEHFVGDALTVNNSMRGLVISTSNAHAMHIGRYLCQNCRTAVYDFTGSAVHGAPLIIDELDLEQAGQTQWGTYNFLGDVYDPGNNLSGSINYWLFQGSGTLRMVGGSGLKLSNIGQISQQAAASPNTLTDGATITWNLAWANAQKQFAEVTLGGDRTLAMAGFQPGASGSLIVCQDATGSRTLTAPTWSYVSGAGAGVFTLSSTAGACDKLDVFYDGSLYYWTVILNFTGTSAYPLISDDFHGAAISSLWTNNSFWAQNASSSLNATAVPVESGPYGLQIAQPLSTANAYNGLRTVSTYTMGTHSISARIISIGPTSSFTTSLGFGLNGSNFAALAYFSSGLHLYVYTGGTQVSDQSVSYTASGSTDSTPGHGNRDSTKLYWKLAVDGSNNVSGYYSADGVTYTQIGTAFAAAWSGGANFLEMSGGTLGSTAAPGLQVFDTFRYQ